MDKIFVPVNVSNAHWCMAVIYVQKKVGCFEMGLRATFHLIDSLRRLGEICLHPVRSSSRPNHPGLYDHLCVYVRMRVIFEAAGENV